MKSNLLMNCLWYEDISPDELATVLEIEPGQLFSKIFDEEKFTADEIQKIVGLLGLSEEEAESIFGNPSCDPEEPEPAEEPEPEHRRTDLITREAVISILCAKCNKKYEWGDKQCPFSGDLVDQCPDVREILDIKPADINKAVTHCGECIHYFLCDGVTLDDGSPYPICMAPGGSGALHPSEDFWCKSAEPKKRLGE